MINNELSIQEIYDKLDFKLHELVIYYDSFNEKTGNFAKRLSFRIDNIPLFIMYLVPVRYEVKVAQNKLVVWI